FKSNPGPIIGSQDGGGGRMAFRQGSGFLGVSSAVGAKSTRGETDRTGNAAEARRNGENCGGAVGYRIRHGDRTRPPIGSEVSQVFEPGGYASQGGYAPDPIHHGVGSAEKRGGPGIQQGSGQISPSRLHQREMGSHSIPDGGGGSSFFGTLVEVIKDRL